MAEFKFVAGQEVMVLSNDPKLNGKVVTIVSQHTATFSEDKFDTERPPWYKVKGEGIIGFLSFYEDQLEA